MFSTRLKELRKNAKITQIEFAKKFNIANGTVGNWESGNRQPDYKTLNEIADFFDVSIDYLLGRNEKTPTPSLSLYEQQLINNFRLLNEEGQEKLLDHSIDLVSSGRYIKSSEHKMVSKEA